jgi:hypothetical protein
MNCVGLSIDLIHLFACVVKYTIAYRLAANAALACKQRAFYPPCLHPIKPEKTEFFVAPRLVAKTANSRVGAPR